MKNIFIIIAFSICAFKGYAQNTYYKKDTITKVGISIKLHDDVSNSNFCHIDDKFSSQKLTPDQINEYGVKDRVFVSKQINIDNQTKRVFLEKITSGKITLYTYPYKSATIYFYSKDGGQLKKFESKNYKEILRFITPDMPEMHSLIKRLSFRSKPIKTAIKYYNNKKDTYIPNPKFGFFIAGLFQKNKIPKTMDLSELNMFMEDLVKSFDFKTAYAIGGFFEKPFSLSHFSFRFEANIHYANYEVRNNTQPAIMFWDESNPDIILKNSTLSINTPIFAIIKQSKLKSRLYNFMGLNLTYNIQNQATLMYCFPDRSTQEISDPAYAQRQVGLIFGAGFEYDINRKTEYFIEARYMPFSSHQTNTLSTLELGVYSGLRF